MRRLLYICFTYPPWNGPGIHRAVRFVRHLPGHGWEPVVLAGRMRGSVPGGPVPVGPEKVWRAFSPFPMPPVAGQVSRSLVVPSRARYESRLRRLGRSLFTPDPQIFWILAALPRALCAVHAAEPAAVLATAPPYSTFILGWLIKRITQLPLILDYRDLWNDNPWYPVPAGFRQRLDPWLEARLVAGADLVVANHDPMRRRLAASIPMLANRCVVIPNGFDRDELGPPVRPSLVEHQPFRIVYAGALYADKIPKRGSASSPSLVQPNALFRALRRFAADELQGRHTLEVEFFGASRTRGQAETVMETARRWGVEKHVKVHETIPKSLLVPHLRNAHALLLFIHDTDVQITQKLYEYMHLEIPVLGLIRNSAPNSELIERSGCGAVVDPEDEDAILSALVGFLEKYRRGAWPETPEREFVDRFDIDRLSARLAACLNELVVGGSHG